MSGERNACCGVTAGVVVRDHVVKVDRVELKLGVVFLTNPTKDWVTDRGPSWVSGRAHA